MPPLTLDTLLLLLSALFTRLPATLLLLALLTANYLSIPLPRPLALSALTYFLLLTTRTALAIVDTHLLNAPDLELGGWGLVRGVLGLGGKKGGKRKRTIKWEKEVVLVTGGAGGLGMELVVRCLERGARVAVVDVVREEEFGERWGRVRGAVSGKGRGNVKEEEEEDVDKLLGARFGIWKADVGEAREIERVKREVLEGLGAPTILINNAGITSSKPLLSLTATDVERTFKVNTLSHFHTIRAFLPSMLRSERGGTVVTVASVLGVLGCAGLSDYTASKAALIALHTSLSAELSFMAAEASSFSPVAPTSSPNPPHAHSPISLILSTPGTLLTPLFAHIPQPPLSSFFGPPVAPSALAERLMQAIESGHRDVTVAMPAYTGAVGWLGVLPGGVARLCRGVVGVDGAGWGGVLVRREGGRG